MNNTDKNKNRILYLFRYMLGTISPKDYCLYFLSAAGVSLVGLFTPRLSYRIFDNLLNGGDYYFIYALIAFFFTTSVFSVLLGAFKSFTIQLLKASAKEKTQKAFMTRLLDLPVSFFRHYGSGDLAERVDESAKICDAVIDLIFSATFTTLLSIIYFIQMLKYSPILAARASIILLTQIILTFVTSLVQISVSSKLSALRVRESGTTFAIINGIRKIRLAGAESRAYKIWENIYKKCLNLAYDPPLILKISGALNTTVALVGQYFLYKTAIRTDTDLVHYIAFSSAFALTSSACANLTSVSISATSIIPAIKLLRPIMHEAAESSDKRNKIEHLNGNISVKNLSFRYSPHTPVIIDDLSLDIKAGDYLAIVGESGSGKSTFIKLLLGFEEPTKGTICYDDSDMKNLSLRDLRKNIGTVLQNGKLLLGSIRSNIAVGSDSLTDEQIWEAAEIAGIADEIRSMPLGMNTMISEGSGTISGGQRQRILIARALASRPGILIFDEATSALDNITQRRISERLDSLGCTRIVIAHRLSTIKQCSRIIYLHDGKIAEEGTYDELIAHKYYFYNLVKRQQIDGELEEESEGSKIDFKKLLKDEQ